MIRRPPRSTQSRSSAASDVYKRQILNNLGGTRHEAKLRAVIEHYTNVPVVGAIQSDARLNIGERHLGLVPNRELGDASCRIKEIGTIIGEQVDLDRIIEIACYTP